jgi:hypothetical protein
MKSRCRYSRHIRSLNGQLPGLQMRHAHRAGDAIHRCPHQCAAPVRGQQGLARCGLRPAGNHPVATIPISRHATAHHPIMTRPRKRGEEARDAHLQRGRLHRSGSPSWLVRQALFPLAPHRSTDAVRPTHRQRRSRCDRQLPAAGAIQARLVQGASGTSGREDSAGSSTSEESGGSE